MFPWYFSFKRWKPFDLVVGANNWKDKQNSIREVLLVFFTPLSLDGQNKYNTGHHQNTVRWQDQNNYSDTGTRCLYIQLWHQINSQSLDRRSKLWVKKGLGLPGSTWWPIFDQSMWYHLVVKFATNAGSATWWPPSNQCRFPSSLSNPRATWWPHLQPIQIS